MMNKIDTLPDDTTTRVAINHLVGDEHQDVDLLDGIVDDPIHTLTSTDFNLFAQFHDILLLDIDKPRKRVSFSTVQVREYSLVLGDHPTTTLPLSLDWKYNAESTVMSVTRHQLTRTASKKRRIRKLGFQERLNRLKEVSGYTERRLYFAEMDCQTQLERELQQLNMTNSHKQHSTISPNGLVGTKRTFQRMLGRTLVKASAGA